MTNAEQELVFTPPENEARIHGLPQIETYGDAPISSDWEITDVMGDILMCEYVDCNEQGTEVCREGIWVPLDVTKRVWRIAKVLKRGLGVSAQIDVNDLIVFPNDKGLKAMTTSIDGKRHHIVFLNEERIFGKCLPSKSNPLYKPIV